MFGEEPEGSYFGGTVEQERLTHPQEHSAQDHPVVTEVDERVGQRPERVQGSTDQEARPEATGVDDVVGGEIGKAEGQEAEDD